MHAAKCFLSTEEYAFNINIKRTDGYFIQNYYTERSVSKGIAGYHSELQ
jgi:hypothetical protein